MIVGKLVGEIVGTQNGLTTAENGLANIFQ